MSPCLARVFLPFICALQLALGASLARADEYAQRVWETDDGLPHNGVNAIVQRRDGFLWFATQNGVVRFDGLEFRKWRSPLLGDAQTSAIRSIIEEDTDGLLLANEPSGLLRLREDGITLHPLSERIEKRAKISLLWREQDGVFWIIFGNRDAWRCHGTEAEVFPAPAGTDTSGSASVTRGGDDAIYLARGNGVERYSGGTLTMLPGIEPRNITICAAGDGALWAASPDKLFRLEREKITVVQEFVPWSAEAPPAVLMEDNRGALWIGTKGLGVFRWQEGHFVPMPVSYPRVTDMLEDDSGNVWVATAGGGINRLQRARFSFIGEDRGIQPYFIGSVCEDVTGEIWFANRVCMGRVRGGVLEPPAFPPEFLRKAGPICSDTAGQLWMVAMNTRVCQWNPVSAEPPHLLEMVSLGNIHALHAARDGSMWVAGDRGPLVRFRAGVPQNYGEAEGYNGRMAQAIGETVTGEIWVGTEQGEIFQLKGGRFVRYDSRDGLPASGVRAIHGDAQGTLWIGTGGGGLVVRHRGKFNVITEQQGLPDDTISQMMEDNFGTLWFGTSRSLFKVRRTEVIDFIEGRSTRISPIVFGKSDGVAGFSAAANYQPSAWKTRSGQLWFATRKGLVSTVPERQQPDEHGPQIYLEAILADNEPVDRTRAALPSTTKKLEFRYTAPIYVSTDRARFRYRLEGVDTDWVDAGPQRSISYPRLAPGHYVFRVTVGNRDLVWNPTGASFAFDVLPAWWETRLAHIVGLVLLVIAVAALILYWSQRRLRRRLAELENRRRIEIERARIARDLHDSLGASLTQAGMLAEELSEDCLGIEEMKECSGELANRVRLIARDLDAAVWAVSPKNDTLASLCAYLCQFSIEFFRGTPTRCRVHTSDDIPAAALTPEVRHHLFLTAREAVNNVLKHAEAREVQISMRMRGPVFEMSIEDDGRGFDVAQAGEGERNGLRNMRGRVAEIGGRIDIRSEPGHTVVQISMPLRSAAPKSPQPAAIH